MDQRQLHKNTLNNTYWITCNSGFQRLTILNLSQCFSIYYISKVNVGEGEVEPAEGAKGRGALTSTVKPTYQSTISFHLIHPEASYRNKHQNNGRDSAHNVDKF